MPPPEFLSPSQQGGMGFFQPQMHQRNMPARGGANSQYFPQRDPRPQFAGNSQSWNNPNYRNNFQDSPPNRRRSEDYHHNDYHSPKRVRRGGSTNYD
jgi:hypothetical protein